MALMESATWHFLLSISRTLKNVSMEMRMVDRNGSWEAWLKPPSSKLNRERRAKYMNKLTVLPVCMHTPLSTVGQMTVPPSDCPWGPSTHPPMIRRMDFFLKLSIAVLVSPTTIFFLSQASSRAASSSSGADWPFCDLPCLRRCLIFLSGLACMFGGKKSDRIVTTEEEICVIKISSSLRLGKYYQAREIGSRGLVLDCLARQTPSSQEAEHVETWEVTCKGSEAQNKGKYEQMQNILALKNKEGGACWGWDRKGEKKREEMAPLST